VATISPTCLDIGSGVGVPGLIWAFLCPETLFFLIESQQKRAAFLQRAISKLEIKNTQVLLTRFENLSPEQIGESTPLIVSRGTMAPIDLWKLILASPILFKDWLVFSSPKTHQDFIQLAIDSPFEVSNLPYPRPTQGEGILTKITPVP